MSVSFCFTILYFPLFVNCKYSIKQYKIFLKIPRLKSGHGYLCNTRAGTVLTRAGTVLTRGTKETYYNQSLTIIYKTIIFLKIPRLKSGHGYLCNTRAGMVLTRGTKETYYNHLQLLPGGISLIV